MKKLHLAIILDGNRRFAKKHMWNPWKGHEDGVKNVKKLLEWSLEFEEIKEVTLYTFSIENFRRDKDEVEHLMKLFETEFNKLLKKPIDERDKVRFKFIGRKHLFPEKIQQHMLQLEDETKKNTRLICNIAMGYGGRSEIIDAVNHIIDDKIQKVDEKIFEKYLYTTSEPDILIRTGGDIRLSNFLLWQSNYSELFFLDKLWPDFKKSDLDDILNEFYSRERRYGK